MDALETLFTRRSIRKYTSEPVSEEDLQTVLEAAMNAPSANNRQPWHFLVVDGPRSAGRDDGRPPLRQNACRGTGRHPRGG